MGRRRWRTEEEEERNPDVECPFCLKKIRKAGLKKHQQSDPCQVLQNKLMAENLGLQRVNDDWKTCELLQGLGISYKCLMDSYYKPSYRRARKTTGLYVPRWAGLIIEWVARIEVYTVTSFGYIQCARALFMAIRDPDLQGVVCATGSVAVNPSDAITAIVLALDKQFVSDSVALPVEAEAIASEKDNDLLDRIQRRIESDQGYEKYKAEAEESFRLNALREANEALLSAQILLEEQAMERDRAWGQEP